MLYLILRAISPASPNCLTAVKFVHELEAERRDDEVVNAWAASYAPGGCLWRRT